MSAAWVAIKKHGRIQYSEGFSKTRSVGVKSCFTELAALGADFTDTFKTARGLGFGFAVLSNKDIRIPKKIRKKMITAVVEAMKVRFLFILNKIIIITHHICQLHTEINIYFRSA